MKCQYVEHLNLPPLVELDGYGCCIECRRNIKAGRRHRPLCTILARKREAAAKTVVVFDPQQAQRKKKAKGATNALPAGYMSHRMTDLELDLLGEQDRCKEMALERGERKKGATT